MTTAVKPLHRHLDDVAPWGETCGSVRCLITAADHAAGEVIHVEIDNAKLHVHHRTDEFYYILDGAGSMILDDEQIAIRAGSVIYVPRGVKHKAIGQLKVLLVCVPRGVLDDVHELE